MWSIPTAEAIEGRGLKGDRYASAVGGSWNKPKSGEPMPMIRKRQLTLIAAESFRGTGFKYQESRRNIITKGIDLMALLKPDTCVQLLIGTAVFQVVKYCDPCDRPSKLCGTPGFKEAFSPDRAGIIVEVIRGGLISIDDEICIR